MATRWNVYEITTDHTLFCQMNGEWFIIERDVYATNTELIITLNKIRIQNNDN